MSGRLRLSLPRRTAKAADQQQSRCAMGREYRHRWPQGPTLYPNPHAHGPRVTCSHQRASQVDTNGAVSRTRLIFVGRVPLSSGSRVAPQETPFSAASSGLFRLRQPAISCKHRQSCAISDGQLLLCGTSSQPPSPHADPFFCHCDCQQSFGDMLLEHASLRAVPRKRT